MGGLKAMMQTIAAMAGWEKAPDHLSYGEFSRIVDALASAIEIRTLFALHKGKVRPVGLVSISRKDHRGEPHAVYFPWASDRNKLETTAVFFHTLGKETLMLVLAKSSDDEFYGRVEKLGLITKVGHIPGFWPEDCTIWRSHA